MTMHDSVAKRVRERKEKHPHLYCPHPRCLWRLSSGPCPKHMKEEEGGAVCVKG